MDRVRIFNIVIILMLCGFAGAEPLELAADKTSEYSIIVSDKASAGIKFAAEELSSFFKQATGATLKIRNDSELSSEKEIVIGNARGFEWKKIDEKLRPATKEGYVIYRNGEKVFILGNSDRGTLYGVYDFLENDLGVRFLTPDYTFVPKKDRLGLDIKSRKYDPPLEYRNVMVKDDLWALRNRLNSNWSGIPMEKEFGGVKWIGPKFVHTFGFLLSPEKYFDSHPEYFSMIDGKRIKVRTQICLSNPEAKKLALQEVVRWIEKAKQKLDQPDNKLIISVSANDCRNFCECPECTKVNEEEKSTAGTLIRFVNQVAEAIDKDYPNVAIDTLAYAGTENPPVITKVHPKVIIRFCPITSDFFRRLDDPESEANVRFYNYLKRWGEICNHIYVWNYHANMNAYLEPFPDMNVVDDNIRIFRDHGMKGYFGQVAQTNCADMFDLRNYLLAKCMWNPKVDSTEVIKEFCQRYYGAAAEDIMRYIKLVEETFASQNVRLSIRNCMKFTPEFLSKANELLAAAEKKAPNQIVKERVQKLRLSVWYLMIEDAMANGNAILKMQEEWAFKTDPENIGDAEKWFALKDYSSWKPVKINKSWTKQGYDYHGVAWYTCDFELPDNISSSDKVAFYFGAVDGRCVVYLDGKKIGEQTQAPAIMWNKGFYIPVKQNLLTAGKHTLVVRVKKNIKAAGIWKPVMLVDLGAKISPELREACVRFKEISTKIGISHMSEFYGKKGKQLKDAFLPKIDMLLSGGIPSASELSNSMKKYAARIKNGKLVYEILPDSDSEIKYCAVQKPSDWTLNQTIGWQVDSFLQKAQASGKNVYLKVRVKVKKKGEDGVAFEFGCRSRYKNWGGPVDASRKVMLSEVKPDKWQEFELKIPLEYKAAPRGQKVFVRAVNNPRNVETVSVDFFELIQK